MRAWQAYAESEPIDAEDAIDPAVEAAVHLLQDPHNEQSMPVLAQQCG